MKKQKRTGARSEAMEVTMKKVYKFAVVLKGSSKDFCLGPGVIATQEVTFNVTPAQERSAMFAASVLDHANAFMKEIVEVRLLSATKAQKKGARK